MLCSRAWLDNVCTDIGRLLDWAVPDMLYTYSSQVMDKFRMCLTRENGVPSDFIAYVQTFDSCETCSKHY